MVITKPTVDDFSDTTVMRVIRKIVEYIIDTLVPAINEGGGGSSYVLPPATKSTLGGIIVGDNLTVDGSGKVNAPTPYKLPIGGTNIGGVKNGGNVTIDAQGNMNAPTTPAYTLPVASTTTLGGVKIGNGVSVGADGTISVSASGGGSSFQSFTDRTALRNWMLSASEGDTLFIWGSTMYVGEPLEFMFFGRKGNDEHFHGIGHAKSTASTVVTDVYASSSYITVSMLSNTGTSTNGALSEIASACAWS